MRRKLSFLLIICMLATVFVFNSATSVKSQSDDFQIAIFWPPVSAHSNATQFDYIRDAHVNEIHNVTSTDLDTVQENINMLNLASTRGIKVSVADSRFSTLPVATDAQIDAMANDYKDHPALYGYYIKDEPEMSEFPGVANAYRRLLYNDPDAVPYVNLLPTYGGIGFPGHTYEQYVDGWIQSVGPSNLKYLSYDHYPWLTAPNSITADYFSNLEYIRQAGLKYNIKTACYLQSVGYNYHRRPNANDLRYNVYTSLAYGMKALYWFTWWTPVTEENFTSAIIDVNGNKTDLYAPVQSLNSKVKNLGSTLMSLTSQGVYHSGYMASGTVPVPSNFFFKPNSTNDHVIVSHFKSTNGRNYVMALNRSLTSTLTLSFNLNPKPTAVTEVSNTTGQEVSTNYNAATGTISASFLPGEGRLYAMPSGFDPLCNLALGKTVTASSSVENWGWYRPKLVDGATVMVPGSAGWASNNSLTTNHTEWVTIDMGATHVINQIKMYPGNNGTTAGFGFPIDFTVQVSTDIANWTTVVRRTGYPNPGFTVPTFTFGRQAARYVRIQGTNLRPNPQDNNIYRMQFCEVELYHNTSASPSSGLFSDNFSGDMSKWVDATSCSIENGALRVTSNNDIRNANGGFDWTNYSFEADVKVTKSAAGLVFRSKDKNNFYMWQLSSGKLTPHKKVNGTWTIIKNVSTTFALNTTYHVKIEANGSTIKTYIDGVLIDTTTDSTFTRGNIGFRTDTAVEEAEVDNVSVTAF